MAYVVNVVERYREVHAAGVQWPKVSDEAKTPRVPMWDQKCGNKLFRHLMDLIDSSRTQKARALGVTLP